MRARSQFHLATRALAAAKDALRLERALAGEGRGEPDAADFAEISSAKTEEELSQASQGLVAARARLLELRGELPAVLLGSGPAPTNRETGSS